MARFWLPAVGVLTLLCVPACGDDGGTDTTTTTTTTSGSTTDMGSSSTDPSTSTTDDSTTSTSTTGSETSGGTTTSDGSTGAVNTCDPVIPGEWNACVDDMDQIDNTLCNWMGVSGATGFIGCLSSSSNETANVCMITGCEDECDCFAPPSSGTAVVECADVLEGGGLACVLTCGNGETCPDGMECIDGICFHPM